MRWAHGADVNARSSDMRTPLMIAARRPGNSAAVKFLLDLWRESQSERASHN